MQLELSAEYMPDYGSGTGEVAIMLNGYTVKSLHPEDRPGAEPRAEEDLILRTIWNWLEEGMA